MKPASFVSLLCFSAILAAPAAASSMRLSVQDAVARALAGHPSLAASAERTAASEALRMQSGLRPNPRLYFQTENLRAHGTPGFSYSQDADTFAYVSQLVETSGKRDRRMEMAGETVRRARLERELLERQIAHRVKAAYWAAVSARKQHDLLEENSRTFRQIVEYHELRVKEGAMAEADLLRVQLEHERLALGANSAGLEADRARIALLREMGETEFPEVDFAETLESPGTAIVDALPESALENRTEMKLARQAVEQARAAQRLQQSLARPDFELLGGYKRTAGFHTMMGGVQFTLPVRDRNQGNIAAAQSEVRAADSALHAEEALVKAEVQAAARDYEIRQRQVRSVLPSLRSRAAESARIAVAAYREGGSDLLRLLDAERVRIDTQLLYYRTLAEFEQSRAALETALGVDPK